MSIIVVPRDFPTVQAAVTAAQPGDLVFVKKGTYHESVNVFNRGLAIVGEKGATLDGNHSLPFGFRVGQSSANLASGIEIKGFTIQNYIQSGITIEFCDFAYCLENVIKNIKNDGIFIKQSVVFTNGATHLFKKNKITNIGENGFNITDPNINVMIQNEIKDVGKNGININVTQSTIPANPFNSIIQNKIQKAGQNGIVSAEQAFSGLILQNEIQHTGSDGISLNNGTMSIIENNITRSKGNGIKVNNPFSSLYQLNISFWNAESGISIISPANVPTQGFNYIEENRTSNNEKDGIHVNQNNNFIVRNRANENDNDGIALDSNDNEVVENFACSNGNQDIENNGTGNSLFRNKDCEQDESRS
ncbi:right-handed parallel beta-helix repeat-containing protein [Paenibacillus sp. BSR1-1]|uniref:right-handed parallel beta-helix repeat-containing protein n=1 Tax=Paenibacillus sp. BSR1-1 TaxID=3020845 RepID=UPI0025B04A3B|nr:right-handed parallel beta-helix repeat-containing protein [Paenibacillus sp. BSR1-1]MDN3018960.1 right-handed parallel beta-helix repeat-containing protein [Paenibacillus sp. BSR1-1]